MVIVEGKLRRASRSYWSRTEGGTGFGTRTNGCLLVHWGDKRNRYDIRSTGSCSLDGVSVVEGVRVPGENVRRLERSDLV